VFQVTAPRAEAITEMGQPLLPAMGVVTVHELPADGGRQGRDHRRFRARRPEVNAVARALRQHGIEVTAIHNHGLFDTPRLFYMHFWANDDPPSWRRALKAALDSANSRNQVARRERHEMGDS
jgi:hypothetical protein